MKHSALNTSFCCAARLWRCGSVAALLACAIGCETHDLGSPCPAMAIPFQPAEELDGGVQWAKGPEVVEFDVEFPCEDPVCVITLGHTPYCSRECATDANCPNGFQCRTVMDLGPFQGMRFCVWKTCAAPSDCGDPWVLGCERVPELSLQQETKVCRYHE
jgi:hypothetical protein